jgi:hypothetical protein
MPSRYRWPEGIDWERVYSEEAARAVRLVMDRIENYLGTEEIGSDSVTEIRKGNRRTP